MNIYKRFIQILFRLNSVSFPFMGIFFLLASLLIVDDAWGRAGGGGSFGGGGGGGGFSGGGSGGGGEGLALYFLIQLLINHPFIGVPALIIFLYLFYKGSQQAKNAHTAGTLRRGTQRNIRAVHENAVDNITRHDANFSMELFSARIKKAFIKSQNAWCAQDILPIRPFVSDGIYERWNLQLEEQKKSGVRDQMEDISVQSILLDNYEISGDTEELTIRVTASAIDYEVSLKTGKRTSGSGSPEQFSEYWTFLRRKGAKTLTDKDGLMEGNCPNCGAAIDINENAKCEHCGALLRSGEYDWVLSEITQEAVYTVNSSRNIPGMPSIRNEDSQLSPRMVEDRASVIFWRYMIANQQQNTTPCLGCCNNTFINELNKAFKEKPNQCYINCAIGAVDLMGFIPGENYNQAVIEITWSGIKANITAKGTRAAAEQCIRRHLYILQRKTGVKSIKTNGVGSAHCPGCGAPEQANDNGQCTYCGFLLNDGSNQWILQDICSRNSSAGREIIASLRESLTSEQNPQDSSVAQESSAGFNMSAYALMAWLCKLAASDGEISENEVTLLKATAKARNLPQEIIEHMIQAAKNGTLDAPEPSDTKEAQLWLQALARMALADGKVTADEKAMMLKAACKLNFTEFDIDQTIKQQRTIMLRRMRNKK